MNVDTLDPDKDFLDEGDDDEDVPLSVISSAGKNKKRRQTSMTNFITVEPSPGTSASSSTSVSVPSVTVNNSKTRSAQSIREILGTTISPEDEVVIRQPHALILELFSKSGQGFSKMQCL